MKAEETGGNGRAAFDRLREVCAFLSAQFSRAVKTCDNDILTRDGVAAGLVEITSAGAAFDDGGIDGELRRIAPFAIRGEHERINGVLGINGDAPEVSESDIEEWVNDFALDPSSQMRITLFGRDVVGIEYSKDPNEIRERKIDFILDWATKELRRNVCEWLNYIII